jgi:L-alanine-DL-glutamate epimerase-like enolase superfamily enzyme
VTRAAHRVSRAPSLSRRDFLGGLAAAPLAGAGRGPALSSPPASDVRLREVRFAYADWVYRAPYKFGGRVVDKVTILDVHARVETRGGRSGWGFGSMTMGNMWSFPSPTLSYDTTLSAMKRLAERIASLFGACAETGHPLDLAHVLEPQCFAAAAEVSREMALDQEVPELCTLVVASPFDAALHDAFGKVHGRNVYATYGPDLLRHDLSRYLGSEFGGQRLERQLLRAPRPRVPLFHSVGGLDPLTASDVVRPIGDGLPETLPEWIERDGLVRVKIKLSGEELQADVDRTLAIDRVTAEAQARRRVSDWKYCLDFNERCPNVGYVLDFLRQVRAGSPAGFARILYVEQPTARDLARSRDNVMHEAARLRPVVIDESLVGLESLRLAREMGYNGVALKACKGQSQAVLMAAAARRYGMFLCVQDLTCPGASLVHSVGLAARVPGVAGIEANARQYVPAANAPWRERFPGIFSVTDGQLRPAEIQGPGLGIPEALVPPPGRS